MTTDSSTRRNCMFWYWQLLGGHVHCRIFMNGGKCGDLCFRGEEFNQLLTLSLTGAISDTAIVFINEVRDPE